MKKFILFFGLVFIVSSCGFKQNVKKPPYATYYKTYPSK